MENMKFVDKFYNQYNHVLLGISIVDSDLTTDIVEPADFNRYVSTLYSQLVLTPNKNTHDDFFFYSIQLLRVRLLTLGWMSQ